MMGVFVVEYQFSNRMSGLKPSAIREIFKVTQDPEVISFAAGNPSPDSFPIRELKDIAADLFENSGKMALQYGRLKKTEWRYGKVIEGAVTKELAEFLLSLPKPSDTEVYNKMTPFFSIFLDNGFSSEHYGTELNGVKENE